MNGDGPQKIDLVRAVHPYSCKDQPQGLAFPQGVVLLVAERSDDGWCRGYAAGNQGWFPASYVQSLSIVKLAKVRIYTSVEKEEGLHHQIYIYMHV